MELSQMIEQTRNKLAVAENRLNHLYNYSAEEIESITLEIWELELDLKLQLERGFKQ